MKKLMLILFLSFEVGIALILIPLVIIEGIFGISLNKNNLFGFFIFIYGMIHMCFIFNNYSEKEKESYDYKINKITIIMVILAFPFLIFCFGGIEKETLSSEKISPEYYKSHREYYKNYSDSNYTPPIEKNSSDKNNITVNTPKVSEEIKIKEQHTEEKISEEQKNQNLISEEKSDENFTLQENEKNNFSEDKKIFQSYSKYTSDEWEYIMSDENGNDYYINKYFSVNIFDNPYEGKTFSAEFKKVFSNGGYEVDVPAFDKNYRRIMEKKILSSEEKIIHFRNENGFKEFKISVITGYDENDSVIIGYGSKQMKDFMKWKSVNNNLYNELYEAAYSKLK